MKISRVGVDLAKNVYQLHGVDAREHVVWQRRLRRGNWLSELQQHVPPGAEIGMESCAGAHHWGRELVEKGSEKGSEPFSLGPFFQRGGYRRLIIDAKNEKGF